MRLSKFTETQIVSILKEAGAGCPVNEIWLTYGISSDMYYEWKARYGGLEASDVKRLKEWKHDNRRLKRRYADLSLENAALKDVIAKSSKACFATSNATKMTPVKDSEVGLSGLPPARVIGSRRSTRGEMNCVGPGLSSTCTMVQS